MDELPAAEEIVRRFRDCGTFARGASLRTCFHPDQFVVLNSPRPEVVEASIRELEYQAEVAGWVGADVLNIHGGGSYGDKPKALAEFARNLARLSPATRSRLTVENDDKTYTPADLLPLCRAEGLPLVYDVHHHRCRPDGLTVEEATEQALATWDREPPVPPLEPSCRLARPQARTPSRLHRPRRLPPVLARPRPDRRGRGEGQGGRGAEADGGAELARVIAVQVTPADHPGRSFPVITQPPSHSTIPVHGGFGNPERGRTEPRSGHFFRNRSRPHHIRTKQQPLQTWYSKTLGWHLHTICVNARLVSAVRPPDGKTKTTVSMSLSVLPVLPHRPTDQPRPSDCPVRPSGWTGRYHRAPRGNSRKFRAASSPSGHVCRGIPSHPLQASPPRCEHGLTSMRQVRTRLDIVVGFYVLFEEGCRGKQARISLEARVGGLRPQDSHPQAFYERSSFGELASGTTRIP